MAEDPRTQLSVADERIEFWALIGDGGAGKSSIIRALTGAGNISRTSGGQSERWQLGYRDGVHKTFVQGSSLQETSIQPKQFIDRVQASPSKRAIVALQPNAICRIGEVFPAAPVYLNAFNTAGWILRGLAVVGRIDRLDDFPDAIALDGWRQNPANTQANRLRENWPIT